MTIQETKPTDMEYCIYCGHNELNKDAEDNLECRRCGLTTAHSEFTVINSAVSAAQRLRPVESSNGYDTGEVYAVEEETLNSAWRLMQAGAWDKALEALIPAALPTLHPPEFAVWRNICMSALTLTNKDLKQRYPLLEVLKHNIQKLGFFLSAGSDEKKYRTLQRLYQGLIQFGKAEAKCLTDYSTGSTLTDTTNRRRADILMNFAETLESLKDDPAYGTEYLKMSVRLCHQCLETGREICNIDGRIGTFICIEEKQLQLASETRRQIKAKILQINEIIIGRDPGFISQPNAPDPIIMPIWLGWMMMLSMFTFTVPAFFVSFLFTDWLADRVIPAIKDYEMIICLVLTTAAYVLITSIIDTMYSNASYNDYFDSAYRRNQSPPDT